MSFFGGNPFSTQTGQLIDRATDGSQASENWAMYMEICDIVNETEEGPKDAIKAIKKKLSQATSGKSHQTVLYTLTVLETLVKNCGKRVHIHVANKDFLQELIKIIGPKNDPPQVVQEKVLNMIQTWADAFQGVPDLKEVGKVYQDLKNKGIEFPMTDLDNMAPIHTPARTTPEVDPAVHRPPARQAPTNASQMSPQRPQPPAPQPPAPRQPNVIPVQGPITMGPEQMGKLKSELDLVEQNTKVFSEMLTEMSPGQANSDLELLQQLNGTCRQMQRRIMELISSVQNEEVTCELLRINDDMNNAFIRYDRFERLRTGQTGSSPAAAQPPPAAAVPPVMPPAQPMRGPPPPQPTGQGTGEPAVANLIDLGETPSPQPAPTAAASPFAAAPATNPGDIHLRLAGMNVNDSSVSNQLNQMPTTTATAGADSDFDMFAQSRQSFDQNTQALGGGSYANQQVDQYQGGLASAVNAKNTGNPLAQKGSDAAPQQLQDRENEYDEMEKWLQQNPAQPKESATSSEFDRFLADRAKEADDLPDAGAAGAQQQQQARGNSRQMQKDDTDNTLFAL